MIKIGVSNSVKEALCRKGLCVASIEWDDILEKEYKPFEDNSVAIKNFKQRIKKYCIVQTFHTGVLTTGPRVEVFNNKDIKILA